jgi:type III pantothenate kinase
VNPIFVADIGNTRIKCAAYKDDRFAGFIIPDDEFPRPEEFLKICLDTAKLSREEVLKWPWIIAGVAPKVCGKFSAFLGKRGFKVRTVESFREIPIQVDVKSPEQVGLDRLLAAVAVTRRVKPGGPAAIISAGTAVTIDLVDSAGAFRGGVILPGFCMMAQALHEYTARLPMLASLDLPPEIPGRSTQAAILGGIRSAIGGAIDRVLEDYRGSEPNLEVFLTGGDAERVEMRHCKPDVRPFLVLAGLAVVAGASP